MVKKAYCIMKKFLTNLLYTEECCDEDMCPECGRGISYYNSDKSFKEHCVELIWFICGYPIVICAYPILIFVEIFEFIKRRFN